MRRAALLLLFACAHAAPRQPGRLFTDLVFTDYTELSSNAELARRMLTPLTLRRGDAMLAETGQHLRDQAIDLAKERFVLYVPAGAPPARGYGLLVYVAPWEEQTKVNFWRPPLDKRGFVFVSAANSGNESKVYDRRMPLALLAYANAKARYPIDPERVYVGGLSGGARVSEMLALGYPDVFRGALLNAGSDPIGGSGIHLPPADLFARFQRLRFVFMTGEKDELNLRDDEIARASLEDHCVFDVAVREAPRLGHVPLDALSMDRALELLDGRGRIDDGRLAECNARLGREIDGRLAKVKAALGRGDREEARSLLGGIDNDYGGLAAERVLALDALLQ